MQNSTQLSSETAAFKSGSHTTEFIGIGTESGQEKKDSAYRPDLDGLRAIAVLSVVGYHLGFSGLSGGFVGVDIFFVLSGFLITSILARDMADSSFSLVRFYERRVRRIVPALAAVFLVTTIVSWFVLLPQELADFARSLVASVSSASNILFWQQSGYFDGPSEMKPLLHTWSLAVEEQFYLVFPVILAALSRYAPKWIRSGILGLAVLSFGISVSSVWAAPVHAFYLIDSRAWELLLGSLLALGLVPQIPSLLLRNLTSMTGFTLIAVAVVTFNSSTYFPGAAALVPCLGASCIIAAGRFGETSLVARLLSARPVVFIGLVSYSLYLWHWPIIVGQKLGLIPWAIFFGRGKASLLLWMLLLAVLSWRFIEQPFRFGSSAPGRKCLFLSAGATFVSLVLVGLILVRSGGAPERFTAQEVRIGSYLSYGGDVLAEREGICFIDRAHPFRYFSAETCLREVRNKPNLLLFGDSHAAHLWPGFSTSFADLNILQATAATCKPFVGEVEKAKPYCNDFRSFVFGVFLKKHHVDGVILSAAWVPSDIASIARTCRYLKNLGLDVYLVGPNPAYDLPLPRLLVSAMLNGDPLLPRRHLGSTTWTLDTQMKTLARTEEVTRYISLVDAMCDENGCIEYASSGVPMEADGNHFTSAGSVWIARKIQESGQLH